MDRLLRTHALPAGVLVVVTVLDLLVGRDHSFLSLVVISPLVAATLVRRRATAVYAVLALVTGALLGIYDRQYGSGALGAQTIRLVGIAVGGLLAEGAATLRAHRDRQLAEARRTAAEAEEAVALATRLLTDPPPVPGLEMAVRYLPAVTRAQVGGDWYDVVPLSCGATMLVIGDVAGHDVDAAVTMAEARGVLRGIAQTVVGSPAQVLTALDGALQRLGGETVLTVVVGVLRHDDDGAVLCWSNAGHPPPMRLGADGSVDVLERTPDLLVGVDPTVPRHDHETRVRRGDTLLLYTDGLVERRGTPLDAGTAWLARELAAQAGRPLPQLCDGVLSGMSDGLADDVAVLAVRLRD